MGLSKLSKIQLGVEGTAGTAVPATTIWRGKGWIDDQHKVVFPGENVGILSGTGRAYVPELLGVIKLDSTPMTFEQSPYLCEMGIKTVTPSKDGAGSGYIQAYGLPTTAAQTIKTYTGEGGDNQQAEEIEYLFARDFEFSGKVNEAWMMTGNLNGRQVTKTTYTGSLSIPTVEEILFNKTKLYINAVSSAFGTTLIADTLLSASIKVKTGFWPFTAGTGQLYFTSPEFDPESYEVTLDISFVHNATGVAEKDAWIAKTPRALRLICEGSATASAGTAYSKKTFIADLCGVWEKFNALEVAGGMTIVSGKMRCVYNSTLTSAGMLTFVHELSALP